jgi:cytochrome c5
MSARRLALLAILATAALGAAPGAHGPARRAAYPARFPDGPGRSIAQRSCLICHSAMLVTQQHKDSTAWEKTVHQMEAWGVHVSPVEHDSLVGYLTRSFGPRSK